MRLCVTGSQGQVASALRAFDGCDGVTILSLARPGFDLAKAENARASIEALRPDAVISAAAFTAVDLAESEPEQALAINSTGPGLISRACAELGIPVIHLSTDYVFNGAKPIPYREEDATGPIGIYGATKLAGEEAVAQANQRHVILRTAWVYSHEGKNFVRSMLRLAQDRPLVSVVGDQFGCPSYAVDIAKILIAVARQAISAPAGDPRFGIFHMAGAGDTSWAGFAMAIFALAGRHGLPTATVRSITTSDYPTPARRPANSRLDCAKLTAAYGLHFPFWHDGLERCMARLASETRL